MEGLLGAIAPEAYADFLVIDGDPLSDLSLLYEDSQAIHSVWKAGEKIA